MGLFTIIKKAYKAIVNTIAPAPAKPAPTKPAPSPQSSANFTPTTLTPQSVATPKPAAQTPAKPAPSPQSSANFTPTTLTPQSVTPPTAKISGGGGGSAPATSLAGGPYPAGQAPPEVVMQDGKIVNQPTNAAEIIGKKLGIGNLKAGDYFNAFSVGGISGAIAKATTKTAATSVAQVGKKGFTDYSIKYTLGTAGTIAVNSATTIATKSWLTKLASTTKNPAFIVSTLVGAIGSYPFAGFIKEEALQTLGFASNAAIQNGDIEGATAAIEMEKEVLNPDVWTGMLQSIPYVNVVTNLKDFYKSAQVKLSVDEKMVEDLKIQIETGETEDDKWVRLKQEQADQEKTMIDYYNSERKKLLAWEEEERKKKDKSEREHRREDIRWEADFWAAERERQRKLEEEDRIAIAKFWAAYKKQAQKLSDDSRPSRLNFGLLR